MIEMTVHRLGLRARDGDPIIVLRETTGDRCLTVKVTSAQANAVMRHTHRVPPFRPQTHEVILQTIAALGAKVVDGILELGDDGTLLGQLTLAQNGKRVVIAADVVDAIVIAMRAGARILVSRELLERFASSDRNKDGNELPTMAAPAPATAPTTAKSANDVFHQFIDTLAALDDLG